MKKQVNTNQQNNKYLSRCQYYGKLIDWDYVEECMILKFAVYTATEYYGNTSTIRIYVPSDMENDIMNELFKGDNYFIIAAPYRVTFKQTYKYRVDLLLNIFKEII